MLYPMEYEFTSDILLMSGEFTFEITVDEDDHSHPDQAYARIVRSYSAEIQPIKTGDKAIDRDMLVEMFGDEVKEAEALAAEKYEEES